MGFGDAQFVGELPTESPWITETQALCVLCCEGNRFVCCSPAVA